MKDLIKKYASKYSLDPAIVYGLCIKESGVNPKDPPAQWRCNPQATRFEKGWHYFFRIKEMAPPGIPVEVEKREQATSFGYMQVMGTVLREYGYRGRLPDILNNAEDQISYGCRHLSNKIQKYGLELGICSYNSGSPRYKDGILANADYLKKVLAYSKGWADG